MAMEYPTGAEQYQPYEKSKQGGKMGGLASDLQSVDLQLSKLRDRLYDVGVKIAGNRPEAVSRANNIKQNATCLTSQVKNILECITDCEEVMGRIEQSI